jgi:hypothetical protein
VAVRAAVRLPADRPCLRSPVRAEDRAARRRLPINRGDWLISSAAVCPSSRPESPVYAASVSRASPKGPPDLRFICAIASILYPLLNRGGTLAVSARGTLCRWIADYHRSPRLPDFISFLGLFELSCDDVLTVADVRPSGKVRVIAPGFTFFNCLLKAILRKFESEVGPSESVLIESRPVPRLRKCQHSTFGATGEALVAYLPLISTNARFPYRYEVCHGGAALGYCLYAAMNEDGALVLLPRRVPSEQGDDDWLYRLDGDGLRRESVPAGELFDSGQFCAVFYATEEAFPERHFREQMRCLP